MKVQKKIENLFSIVFSENVIKRVEKYILYLASVGFVIHLSLIFLNTFGLFLQRYIIQSISISNRIFIKANSEKLLLTFSILDEYRLSRGDMLLKLLLICHFISNFKYNLYIKKI